MDTFEGDAVLVDEACAAEGEVDDELELFEWDGEPKPATYPACEGLED